MECSSSCSGCARLKFYFELKMLKTLHLSVGYRTLFRTRWSLVLKTRRETARSSSSMLNGSALLLPTARCRLCLKTAVAAAAESLCGERTLRAFLLGGECARQVHLAASAISACVVPPVCVVLSCAPKKLAQSSYLAHIAPQHNYIEWECLQKWYF